MNTNTLYMEHRWGTRVALFTPAQVTTASGRTFNATVCNASLSGAFIETPGRLPVLSRIDGSYEKFCRIAEREHVTHYAESGEPHRKAFHLGVENAQE